MLKPGDPAPSFDLPAVQSGRIGRLSLTQINSEMVVLFFYPRDFSFICPTEVLGFNKMRGAFAAEKTALAGVSVDDAASHLKWARELGGIDYPLLADVDGALTKAFGVFDTREQTALRATFILDRERRVAYAVASPVNVGRNVGETLRVVRALRSGRLCPADWQPGDESAPLNLKH